MSESYEPCPAFCTRESAPTAVAVERAEVESWPTQWPSGVRSARRAERAVPWAAPRRFNSTIVIRRCLSPDHLPDPLPGVAFSPPLSHDRFPTLVPAYTFVRGFREHLANSLNVSNAPL